MDFLNDIDKESLTDAPDTRIFTSMSYKLEYKKNYIMFSAIPSLIEKLIYLALFIISIFCKLVITLFSYKRFRS